MFGRIQSAGTDDEMEPVNCIPVRMQWWLCFVSACVTVPNGITLRAESCRRPVRDHWVGDGRGRPVRGGAGRRMPPQSAGVDIISITINNNTPVQIALQAARVKKRGNMSRRRRSFHPGRLNIVKRRNSGSSVGCCVQIWRLGRQNKGKKTNSPRGGLKVEK